MFTKICLQSRPCAYWRYFPYKLLDNVSLGMVNEAGVFGCGLALVSYKYCFRNVTSYNRISYSKKYIQATPGKSDRFTPLHQKFVVVHAGSSGILLVQDRALVKNCHAVYTVHHRELFEWLIGFIKEKNDFIKMSIYLCNAVHDHLFVGM